MSTQTDEPDYVLLNAPAPAAQPASPEVDPESSPYAADAQDDPKRPWYSGFCGSGPLCRDGRRTNKAGEVIRHCVYVAQNGANAPRRFMYCACACHRDPARGGQALAHD